MLRRTKENFFSLGIISLITLAFLYHALQLEFFESKIMPICIGTITMLLLAMAFYHEYTKTRCQTLSEDENSTEDIGAHDMKTLKCVLPLFGLAALIYVFGFYAAALLFIFFYMKISGSSLHSSVIISTLCTTFIYAAFPILLETPLYTGVLLQHFNLPF